MPTRYSHIFSYQHIAVGETAEPATKSDNYKAFPRASKISLLVGAYLSLDALAESTFSSVTTAISEKNAVVGMDRTNNIDCVSQAEY